MRKPISKTFTVGTRCKTSFLTSTTTAVGTQQMSKIQKIGRQTKNYSITMSMQKSFNQSAQLIKS